MDVCEASDTTDSLGSNTYCDEKTCGAGEGDCDSDSQCASGLICVDDVGANYGFRDIVDVCEASPTQDALGSDTFCDQISCGAGEGDCDSDSQCQAGLVCVADVGEKYGFRAIVDVCEASSTVAALGSDSFCDELSCGAGEGDCDSDSQCQTGLVCVNDVGANYGFRDVVDVCEESATPIAVGSDDYCDMTTCAEGEGDCDSDAQCQAGLICVNDVGENYGFRAPVDVCEAPAAGDAQIGGIWQGSITSNEGTLEYEAITADDGAFRFFSIDTRTQFRGTLSASNNDLSGSGVAVLNGTSANDITISGQINEQNSLVANWQSPSGDSGNINLQYWDIYERSSSLSKLDGDWTAFSDGQAWLELNFRSGVVTGTDALRWDPRLGAAVVPRGFSWSKIVIMLATRYLKHNRVTAIGWGSAGGVWVSTECIEV